MRSIPKSEMIADETDIEHALAFKGDAHLVELQSALRRIKKGEYGTCIICKGSIPVKELEQAPTKRVCNQCAREEI
jgi:RNA polymerase-binding transcription factor DksA